MDLLIELFDKTHIKNDFDCGHPSLDNYLKTQAGQDVKRGLSVCYVLTGQPDKTIVGYYTLSSNSVKLEDLPEELRRKLPPSYKSIPTALLGRLAVNKKYQGQKLGLYLLIDALNRCADLSENIGTLAVLVDPIDDKAVSFYRNYGFIDLINSNAMFITIKTIRDSRLK